MLDKLHLHYQMYIYYLVHGIPCGFSFISGTGATSSIGGAGCSTVKSIEGLSENKSSNLAVKFILKKY